MKLNAHAVDAATWAAAIWAHPEALAYLRGQRHLTDASIRTWGIGYCDSNSHLMGGRVTFPIRDALGNVVAVAGRSIRDARPRWWHFSYEKSRYVYGVHLLVPCEYVVLCEGQIDAVLLRQSGYSACAVMGSSLDPIAAALLRVWTGKVVVYPDNTVPDEKAFEKALGWLPRLKQVGLAAQFPHRPYPDDKCSDPADLVVGDVAWLRRQVTACAERLRAGDDGLRLEEVQV